MNNRINKIHEKALRRVYKDETNLSLDNLLKKNKSVGIKEVYKPKKSTKSTKRQKSIK